MRRQLAALVALLALTLMAQAADTPAPVAPPTAGPKARLEALKKRVTGIVKKRWVGLEVKLARMTGPTEAKLTFHERDTDFVFSVWLRYYDGRWTTTRPDVSWAARHEDRTKLVHVIMLVIDESEEG